MSEPQDSNQENLPQNPDLASPAGSDYPVVYPPDPPTVSFAPVPAPGQGQPGDYSYPGGYPPTPSAYPGAYPTPRVNQAAPVPPSYSGNPGFPPHPNFAQNPPYPPEPPAPYTSNSQFPPVPPQRKKPRKNAVIMMLVALVVVLVAALTLGGIWVYRQHSTSALENGIVPTVTKTVVVIKKVEIPEDAASDAPENPLWYPLRIDDRYTLVIWYKFTNQQLKGLSYQAVSSENGKKVAIADTGITLPVKDGENLPKCPDSQRYQIKDKTLQCAAVKTVKKDSFSIPRAGKESGDKDSSSTAKDSTDSVSGETLGTVGNVRIVASPSALQTNTIFGIDSDDNLLWSKTLKQPGRSVLSGEKLSIFNWNEDGKVTNTIYVGAKNADKAESSSAGATTKKDAIKNFDFANTQWSLPRKYSSPDCQIYHEDKKSECAQRENYQFEDGKYFLTSEQEQQIKQELDIDSSTHETDPIHRLWYGQVDEDNNPTGDYSVEYLDINDDGYLDAVVPVVSISPFNSQMDISFSYYVWVMNPVTGVPEQTNTPIYFGGRCSETYKNVEIKKDGATPQLIVNTMTWGGEPCCGCDRDVPKQRSTWHYDAKRHDMVCDQDDGDKVDD